MSYLHDKDQESSLPDTALPTPSTRNVTIDPMSRAIPVDDPAIEMIWDRRTETTHSAAAWIAKHRYDRIVKARNAITSAIRRDEPRIVCPICGVPVRLLASPDKRFFFRHCVEDGSCPAVSRGNLDQQEIRALKYDGAKESAAHRTIKELIAASLAADPRCTDAQIETTWKAADGSGLRRPDVQATIAGTRVAFEAQLSTTFLDVVVERQEFYRREGAVLLWVLSRFDPGERRMTTDDLLFSNNSNVFVINKRTAQASVRHGRFMLLCHHRELHLDDALEIQEHWASKLVGFDELTTDVEGSRCFLYDFEAEEARIRVERSTAVRQRDLNLLHTEIIAYLDRYARIDGHQYETARTTWNAISQKALVMGFRVPTFEPGNQRVIAAMMSAKHGRVIGAHFRNLIEVAHLVANSYPELLIPFGHALAAYGTRAIVEAQDGSGKWRRKIEQMRPRMHAKDPQFYIPLPYAETMIDLFPEIARHFKTRTAYAAH